VAQGFVIGMGDNFRILLIKVGQFYVVKTRQVGSHYPIVNEEKRRKRARMH
jgi:hypothetical protein